MSQPRPPRDTLAEILSVQPEGDGAFGAQLESFWGTSLGGDLLGRAVRAGDVAAAFVMLARSERTTGAVLPVDGGNMAAAPR